MICDLQDKLSKNLLFSYQWNSLKFFVSKKWNIPFIDKAINSTPCASKFPSSKSEPNLGKKL